jgi:hypothetical protein
MVVAASAATSVLNLESELENLEDLPVESRPSTRLTTRLTTRSYSRGVGVQIAKTITALLEAKR